MEKAKYVELSVGLTRKIRAVKKVLKEDPADREKELNKLHRLTVIRKELDFLIDNL